MTRTLAPRASVDRSGSAWTSVVRSAGVRILILPLTTVLGIVNTRLIIEHFGETEFAQYGLLVGIVALIPFADLGMTAVIVNVVGQADAPAHDNTVRLTLVSAFRVLTASAAVLALICLTITAGGWWPDLLGDGLDAGSGATAATLCGLLIAATMLVSFGQRVLIGLGKNHVTIAVSAAQTPVVLLTVVLFIFFDAPLGAYIAVAAYAATFVISAFVCWVANRQLRPVITQALREARRLRSVRGARVFDVAWPMLVQMIALPLAVQTDRLVLSHVADVNDLARYNLASQMFTPVWAVVAAAGTALWPIFARARVRPGSGATSPLRMSLAFGGAATLVCGALAVLSPWLASIASGDTLRLGVALPVVFSLFMILQALKYPLGMYLTDARGLRFQAYLILLLLPMNLVLSIWLARVWGAVGPVVGSVISVGLCQVLANWLYVRREIARRAAAPTPGADDTEADDTEADDTEAGALDAGPQA